VPTLFALVYFTAFEFQDSAQSESFGAAFIGAYIWLLLKGRKSRKSSWLFVAGIAVGCAVLLKTTFVLFALLLPLAGPSTGIREQVKRSAILLAGILIPLAVTGGYFTAFGALGYLGELLEAQRAYGSLPDSAGLERAYRSTARFFRERPAMVMLCVLAAGSLYGSVRARNPRTFVWWAWAVVGALMIAVQWRCHSYHFLVLLPPLSLLAGEAIEKLSPSSFSSSTVRKPIPQSVMAAIVALVLLVPVAMGMGRFGLAVQRVTGRISEKQHWACFAAPGWYPFANSAVVADYVGINSLESDRVLVFAYDPAIYFLAGRAAPTRHLSNEPIVGSIFFPGWLRNRWKNELIDDVNARPPKLLVVGNCPHCYGLSDEHVFAPEKVRMGKTRYRLLTSITKDRIYEREVEDQSVSTGALIRSRIRTTASGE
jgi:hypothetical protein